MSPLARFFFYTYVVTLVVAGAWGAVLGSADLSVFLGVDRARLAPLTAATLLSQLRFLRAVELGVGLVALRFRQEILRPGTANRAFLMLMALGIAGRAIGFLLDGRSRPIMYVFAAYELVGWVLIFLATRPSRAPTRAP